MKKTFYILLFLSSSIFAQHKFAWITDMHIGYDSADVELEKIVTQINSFDNISFILASGDITEKSRNNEFDRAREILDELEKPLLIIPGNHDTKWSNSGGSKFIEIWDDDKFIYKKDSTVYIGMNSAIPLRGGGGHFRPEDISWLSDELSRIDSSKEIVFVSHHPLNEDIDNWFKVSNLLRNHRIKVVMNGHNHKTEKNIYNGIPAIMARSTLSQNKESFGFVIVENQKDSLKFYEVEKDTIPKLWGSISKTDSLSIPHIDLTQFFTNNAEIFFQKDIKTTLVAQPLFWKEKIYVADYTGLVSCFNIQGKLLWDYDTFGDITGKPSIVGNKFIVSTVQGELTILDAQNGDQIETIGFDEYLIAPPVIYDHKGAKNFIIPKHTKSNSAVILASASGKIYSYDLETLQELWTNEEATDMIEVAPMVLGNQIIFGSWDTHLYSIDANSGTTIWKWQGNESFYYSPAACKPVTDGKYLYFTTPDKMVYAVDLRQGTTKWKKKEYNAWESVGISKNGKRLFIKSVEDKFHIISAKNGNLIKTVNVNYGLDTMPITPIEWNDRVVFSSKDGNIYRINKKYRDKSVLFLGTSRVHSVQKIDKKRLMASNMDGKIVIFNIVGD
ncbi:MAG: PQQ-binding-like beta-propeller repeat protein [Melioribacteraceae bacterium]|jgi:outer membrane protein assembly factor BamB/predicted MPP superfamily phosphohydrolase|nr:PQQ-binding-like beta-propeller repeat protein [Melioribacteraceae bacterium]